MLFYVVLSLFFLISAATGANPGVLTPVTWLTTRVGYPVSFGLNSGLHGNEFSFVLLFLAALIQGYAFNYFKKDPDSPRFSLLLSLFVFFMLLMINTTSFVFFFVSWEGVGLLSFLLVSFWYSKINTFKSGMKVLFYNRLGDFFFFVAVGLALFKAKSDDIGSAAALLEISPVSFLNSASLVSVESFLMFSVAIVILSKSAQFGFHI